MKYVKVINSIACLGSIDVHTYRFGAVLAVTVTTSRKIITIIVSFILWPKPMTTKHILGGICFIFGLFIDVYSRNQDEEIFVYLRHQVQSRWRKVTGDDLNVCIITNLSNYRVSISLYLFFKDEKFVNIFFRN